MDGVDVVSWGLKELFSSPPDDICSSFLTMFLTERIELIFTTILFKGLARSLANCCAAITVPREYLVNPYQMVATNGRYYLIANVERYDNVSHYRLDHIRDIEITDTPAKPQQKVQGLENGLDLPKHMAEHVYMFAGESQRVIMRTNPSMAGELIDWFGSGVTFSDETENSVIAHVTANLQAMRFWALQYAPYVTVLAPQSLVDMVKEDLEGAIAKYKGGTLDE